MAAEGRNEGRLFDLYRTYIGEPEDRTDVYLGFGLFLGGIGLAVVALILFVWSSTLDPRSPEYFTWLTPAYMIGMVSLPVLMLGIVVLLPAEQRVLYVSVTGLTITVIAAIGFWRVYPSDWLYGDNYTAIVVATYAIGLAAITASTGAALIAHYLDMARSVRTLESDDDEDEEGETISDEDVRADIDDAMEGVELSWGGVEKTDHKRLSFTETEFEASNLDTGAKTTRSSGVDAQVANLKGLKGGEKKKTTSSSTVDDQTAKLKELREKRRQEQEATAQKQDSPVRSFLDRVRAVLKRD